uniref:Uncharacterized protein n=1 Tax=Pinguiococcus pyrenoidosus TaxID=172671 RepID=A0A7R9UDW0_9STRA|mmetsp:Transcript_7050/g.27047  ORF Transcript_7050/g.27047 Transcript_7050/m.27047 type:complete len:132 (+) Transcript_7050:76-471(+)
MDGYVNYLALGHGFCGVVLSLSSFLGDPDLALLVLDTICSFGAVLWLNHIDKYGGGDTAVYMFRLIAVTSALGASAVLVRRRHFVWPEEQAELAEEAARQKYTGFELLNAVLDEDANQPRSARNKRERRSR